jgi:hypothetical protein
MNRFWECALGSMAQERMQLCSPVKRHWTFGFYRRGWKFSGQVEQLLASQGGLDLSYFSNEESDSSNTNHTRGYIQKFPDWVDNEINNNSKHSFRSNTKGYDGKTH